jgi:hypothetical protein
MLRHGIYYISVCTVDPPLPYAAREQDDRVCLSVYLCVCVCVCVCRPFHTSRSRGEKRMDLLIHAGAHEHELLL